jgi:hypothetical protein
LSRRSQKKKKTVREHVLRGAMHECPPSTFVIKKGNCPSCHPFSQKQGRIALGSVDLPQLSPRAARKPLTPVRTLSLLARQVFLFDR